MAEVVRHGDRWGVVETPGEPPISEHATREAALLAAGEGATVREDDPTGLDRVQDRDAGEETPGAPGEGGGAGYEGGADARGAGQLGDGAVERQAGL